MTRVSIVTVCYNSERTLNNCLRSVADQLHQDVEHIIIDACSDDNTVSIIENYKSESKHQVKFISERDGGIYDAMNKGIKLSSGEIIGFLNSDDVYQDEFTLQYIDNLFDSNTMAVCGATVFINDANEVRRVWKPSSPRWYNFTIGWSLPHPSLFVRREVFQQIGFFDLGFTRCADYDWIIRMMKAVKISELSTTSKIVARMRIGGVTNRGVLSKLEKTKQLFLARSHNFSYFSACLGVIGNIVFKSTQYVKREDK